MPTNVKRAFSGIFSRAIVVCLLALFIAIALIAMFSTVGVGDEIEWIGMTAKPLGAEAAAALGIPSDMCGVIVGEVDGIARSAGMRHGDVLLGINGQPVRDLTDFSRLAGKTDLSKGGTQLDVVRRGVRTSVFVLPPGGAAHIPGQAAPGAGTGTREGLFRVPVPTLIDQLWLGIEAETFAAGEGRELGIPAGVGGVLVEGVVRGGRAEQAGLAAGDVIVSVSGWKTDTAADLWNTLAGLNGADRVEFGIYRRGRLMSVALPAALGTLAGGFPGRMGGWGLGPGGFLLCPSCGTRVAHQRGVPCFAVPCPSCGTLMIRAQ